MDNYATSPIQQQRDHNDHHVSAPSTTEPPPSPPSSAAVQSLDTVRALHSTVVSLRSALEEAHREIDQLRRQIGVGEVCASGRALRSRSQPQLPSESPRSGPRKSSLRQPAVRSEGGATSSASGTFRSQSQQGTYTIHVQQQDEPHRRTSPATKTKTKVSGRNPITASRIGLQIKVSSNVKVRRNAAEMNSTGNIYRRA